MLYRRKMKAWQMNAWEENNIAELVWKLEGLMIRFLNNVLCFRTRHQKSRLIFKYVFIQLYVSYHIILGISDNSII